MNFHLMNVSNVLSIGQNMKRIFKTFVNDFVYLNIESTQKNIFYSVYDSKARTWMRNFRQEVKMNKVVDEKLKLVSKVWRQANEVKTVNEVVIQFKIAPLRL